MARANASHSRVTKPRSRPAASTAFVDRGGAVGLEIAILFQQQVGAEQKVAGVPQIAFVHITLGLRLVGLFDELLDGEDIGADGGAGADVAVFGRRAGRPHSERNDPFVCGGPRCRNTGFGESARVGDDVIGGQRHDDGILVTIVGEQGAGNDRRPGIAPHRFKQDVGFRREGGELLGDEKPILVVGHDDRPAKQGRIGNATNGFLKGRIGTEERQELLGPVFTRRGP